MTLADLAILVVGSAVGLVLLRFSRETRRGYIGFVDAGQRIAFWYVPLSLAMAATLLIARAIRPRPRRRAVFRQPGTVAASMILLQILSEVLAHTWHGWLAPIFRLSVFRPDFNYYLLANRDSGRWVAAAWATLALSGAWRPEPSWVDRSGRLLGIASMTLWLWSSLIW